MARQPTIASSLAEAAGYLFFLAIFCFCSDFACLLRFFFKSWSLRSKRGRDTRAVNMAKTRSRSRSSQLTARNSQLAVFASSSRPARQDHLRFAHSILCYIYTSPLFLWFIYWPPVSVDGKISLNPKEQLSSGADENFVFQRIFIHFLRASLAVTCARVQLKRHFYGEYLERNWFPLYEKGFHS